MAATNIIAAKYWHPHLLFIIAILIITIWKGVQNIIVTKHWPPVSFICYWRGGSRYYGREILNFPLPLIFNCYWRGGLCYNGRDKYYGRKIFTSNIIGAKYWTSSFHLNMGLKKLCPRNILTLSSLTQLECTQQLYNYRETCLNNTKRLYMTRYTDIKHCYTLLHLEQ